MAPKRNKIAIGLLTLLTTTLVTAAEQGYWDKIFEASQRSRLRAELSQFQLYPIDAPISSTFGDRLHPIKSVMTHHAGIDLAAPIGEDFVAVADGVVSKAQESGGYGNLIEIQHKNGITTKYAHASEILVRIGQRVDKGQTIGRVGETGMVTGPHVHFEIVRQGKPIDPEDYILSRRSMSIDDYVAQNAREPLQPSHNAIERFEQVLLATQMKKVEIEEPSQIENLLQQVAPSEIVSIDKETNVKIEPFIQLTTMKDVEIANEKSEPAVVAVISADIVPDEAVEEAVFAGARLEQRDLIQGVEVFTLQSVWQIASELKTDVGGNVSLQDIMDLMVELNPRAFKEGDVNYRYSHVPLYIPSVEYLAHNLDKTITTSLPMWTLASRLRSNYVSKVSIYQLMGAIVHKNPSAFIHSNPSKRLADVELRLPTEKEVTFQSRGEAYLSYKRGLESNTLAISQG